METSTNTDSWIVDKHNWTRRRSEIQPLILITVLKQESRLKVLTWSNEKQETINPIAAIALYQTWGDWSNFEDENYSTLLQRVKPWVQSV